MAESLSFNIGADTSGFQTGIGSILTGLAGLAAAFVSVQAIVEGFSQAIELGGRLHDLSTRTGETAGNLAILERAFENTSVGAEKLGPAIAKMQDNIIAASKAGSTAAAAFEKLGLSVDDLIGKSAIEQLELIGYRLSGVGNETKRTQIAIDIFGRSGSELIPVLVNMGAELDLAKGQLGSLPGILDRGSASMDSLGDNLSAIRKKTIEFAAGVLSEVIPAIEQMTGKLSRLDAAGIGAEFGQALVGAFAAPMKASELLGDLLRLGAQRMGNELIYQVQYWKDVLFNTFSTLGVDIIPMMGNSMTGAFALAVGNLGTLLADTLRPVADLLGLDFIEDMARGSADLMVQGSAKLAESANAFAVALEGAKNSSTVVRQDFTGAEASSAKIKEDFATLQVSAKSAMNELSIFTPTGGAIAEFGGGNVFGEPELTTGLFNETQATLAMMAAPGGGGGGGGGGGIQSAAQIQAALNARLGLVAAASPTQAIGQSASARRAQEAQKELDTLVALGKGGTREAEALRESIARNQAIAFAPKLTAGEEQAARDWALDQWMMDTSQSYTELEETARQNLLEGKTADMTAAQEAQKKKAAEAGKTPEQQARTVQSIANAVLNILQKIEPKLPQHIMA